MAGTVRADISRPLRNRYARRLEGLRSDRASWLSTWEEVARYVDPRGIMKRGTVYNDGSRKDQSIYNDVPRLALRNLRSGMFGGMTNPAQPWFHLTVAEPELAQSRNVKVHLERCADILNSAFARSNLYNVLHACYGHLGAYGVAAILVEEDDEDDIRATLLPMGEFFLSANADGDVDTCYREFRMTVRQVVEKFGRDRVTESTGKRYDSNQLDGWVDVIHAIEPRPVGERDGESADSRDMPWSSVYVEASAEDVDGHPKVLAEGGYEAFPVLCPRWDHHAGETYGESPAMLALGTIKSLQVLELRKHEVLAKLVNPPMVLVGDVRGAKASLQPGAITRVSQASGENGFKPAYTVNPDLSALAQEIQREEDIVRKAFFEDLFLTISQLETVRTATDILERKNEKLLMLGPVVQTLEKELLRPLIARVFGILQRRRLLPEAPAEFLDLAGRMGRKVRIRPEFEGTLASSQKSQSVGHIEAFMQLVGGIMGVSQDPAMRVDFGELVKEIAMKTGVTALCIRDDREVESMRKEREEAERKQQMLDAATQGAQGAKVLSEARMDEGSMLGQLMGGTGM